MPSAPKFYATSGRAFLGRQFTSRCPRSLATPIHHAVDGREVRDLPFEIPLWSNWGRRYGEKPRSWGAIHFALLAFSCTPIHRAVAHAGAWFCCSLDHRVETFLASACCFSSGLAYTGFMAYLSFYHLVVALFASGGCFSLDLASGGFSRSRCCPPQRATQQALARDRTSKVFSGVGFSS